MTSWADFERAEPALAEAVRATFAVRKHATMATIRRDGSPRMSGTEVDFRDDGHVYLGMMPGARRADDLRRDPRMALHSPTVDTPEDNPVTWLGDGKIDAVASEIGDHLFRLDLNRVVLTRVVDGGLEITTWQPGRGLNVVRR